MKSNTKEKSFDCVKMMREIRNNINEDIKDMCFKELKEYIKFNLKGQKLVGVNTNSRL